MQIGIIGAGASGLMAAISASKNGAKVVLIEKKDRVGKKILVTGNGKCNFTNRIMEKKDFHSQSGKVYDDYVGQFNEAEAISFFKNAGMLMKERNGYYYPRSEQASTVLDILRQKIKMAEIEVLTQCYPVSIFKKKKNFEVILNTGKKLYFDRLILACGSYAGEKTRDEFSAYNYAKSFGHSIVPVVPALVQVRAKEKEFKSIAGVRCDAKIQLYINNKKVTEENGELQLTDYGISGIPVFQLSRYASYGIYEKKAVMAKIDFLPEFSMEQWISFVEKKWNNASKSLTAEEFFQGFLNKKLNLMFLKLEQIKADTLLEKLSWKQIKKAVTTMKEWEITIEGTNPYENAQVCAGGVSLDEVTMHLESKLVPGLFFAGELLDVDGRCGGYNLQWAWSSGYIAGTYAGASLAKRTN